MISIEFYIQFSSLGEITLAQSKLIESEMQRRIEHEFPEASVCVEIVTFGFDRLIVFDPSYERNDYIADRVFEIYRNVLCQLLPLANDDSI
ncbi:hypothetical protein DRV69_24890 [Salmonella enterica subsp. diarizonae]|nr:hypothetical protein [Salmonella enterica subsp. diarizonae]